MKCDKCNKNLTNLIQIIREGQRGGYIKTRAFGIDLLLCIRCYNDEYDRLYSIKHKEG